MFEKFFSFPAVLRRHREGPLASERLEYLRYLNDRGAALGTVLRHARYCLCVAREIQRWPREHCFNAAELEAIAASWAARRVSTGTGCRSSLAEGAVRFCCIVAFWNGLAAWPTIQIRRPAAMMRGSKISSRTSARNAGLALATRKNRAVAHPALPQLSGPRGTIPSNASLPDHVDTYLKHLGQTWSRVSLASTAKPCELGFAIARSGEGHRPVWPTPILTPRIYRHEGLPLGPTWEQVKSIIPDSPGDKPFQLRDRAILLLLAVYGLRSGEVRHLRLDDIDWNKDRLSVVRSKSGQRELLPLEPHTGNAIARYLRQGRPKCDSRCVFVTLHAPFRPLSAGALYHLVSHRLFPLLGSGKA